MAIKQSPSSATVVKSRTHARTIYFKIFAVLLFICLACFSLIFYRLSDKSLPTSFIKESDRIHYSAKVIGSGYVKDCGSGAGIGPAVLVCAGRYQQVFRSVGSVCQDYLQFDNAVHNAGYQVVYQTTYGYEYFEDQSGKSDICSALEYADSVKDNSMVKIIEYSYGKNTTDTGTFYIQCQIGTKNYPYDMDKTLGITTSPAIADRTAVYGCALQHNL